MRPPRFSQRSLNPILRRIRQLWLRVVSKRFVHRHQVPRGRIGSQTFKRIRFGDAWTAQQTANALDRFDGSGVLPRLHARFDDELLVEYVEGRQLARIGREAADALARFYARIHEGGTYLAVTADTRIIEDVRRDLDFLRNTEVIDVACAEQVAETLASLAPPRVLLGWDYTDAVPKNFVWREDGTLVGIDVEALRSDGLVGIGIAKSLSRGDDSYRADFLEAFGKVSRLDLEPQLPLAELCFQVRSLKRRLLKGSPLDPAGLARFRSRSD